VRLIGGFCQSVDSVFFDYAAKIDCRFLHCDSVPDGLAGRIVLTKYRNKQAKDPYKTIDK